MGCGQGASSLFLAREGFDVTALDGSSSAISKLIIRACRADTPMRYVVSEMADTHLPDEEFHGVIDVVALAHNENPQSIVKEIHRVLKPDGRLFSVIPTSETYREPFEKYGAIQFLTHDDVWDLFGGWFTLSIGWVKELTHTGKLLEHWIISGTKS